MPVSDGSTSSWIGFIFVFNLIVGTGALTLPAVFANCGWLLSLFVVVALAIVSYMTASFVVESLACANAVTTWRSFEFRERIDDRSGEDDELLDDSNNNDHTSELLRAELPVYYKLDRKFELGEMASLFFNDYGRMIFYLSLSIYLYGDLSIYAAAIAKTLRDITCDSQNITQGTIGNASGLRMISLSYNGGDQDITADCWLNYAQGLTRFSVYRIYLVFFFVLLGPLTFARSAQKTKYLQIFTVGCRWAAFGLMFSIAVKMLVSDGVKGHPVASNIYGMPPLLGACVYSFMSHHSLPSLITPIRDKKKIHSVLFADYTLICLFYILLAMTGIFAFKDIKDLYTLNFIPSSGDKIFVIIDYFLALFPVFTLSTSFPIIAITLRNNLQTLFLDMSRIETYNFGIRHLIFPVAAILPPFVITYFTQNVTSLVAFTGNFAGNGIQYLIPITLVFLARRTCRELLGSGVINEFRSSFQSFYWLVIVMIWSFVCMCLVTLNFFSKSL